MQNRKLEDQVVNYVGSNARITRKTRVVRTGAHYIEGLHGDRRWTATWNHGQLSNITWHEHVDPFAGLG